MNEAEMKIAALKFSIEMCQATRLATIEECARVAHRYGTNAQRRAASHENDAAKQAALDKFTAAVEIEEAIRSLKNAASVDNREG